MEPGITTPERLLVEVEWVRRLAGVLVRDAADADDVAQEAWLYALHQGGARRGRLRGWLGAVTRSTARARARREARRRELEPEAARPDAAPPGDDALAERAVAQRNVVDHVLALGEPYRRVVLLRYFEGLLPAEIAARERTPLATVKTRLARALEELRERLDGEHGGRAAWAALLSPCVPKAGAAATAGLSVGISIVSTKWIACAAVAAVAVAGGWWWSARGEAAAEPAVAARERGAIAPERAGSGGAGRSTAETALDGPGAPSAAPDPGAARTAVAASPAPARMTIRVVDAASGARVPGARVFVVANAALQRVASGREPGLWFNPVGAVLGIAGEREADARGEVVLELAAGDPAAGSAEPGAPGAPDAIDAMGAGAAGNTSAGLRTGERGSIVARSGDRLGFAAARFEAGATVEVALRGDRALSFRTVDEAGAPLPGVAVGLRIGPAGATPEIVARTGGADALGAFEHFDALFGPTLEEGVPIALVLAAPAANVGDVPVTDAAFDDVVTFVVPRTGAIEVAVRDEDGRPLDGELVELKNLDLGDRATARSADGVARFERVGLGLAYRAALMPPPGGARRRVETPVAGPREPGELVRVELAYEADAPVLAGRIVDEHGAPLEPVLARLTVLATAHGVEQEVGMAELRCDADGAFRASPTSLFSPGRMDAVRGTARVLVGVHARSGALELLAETAVELPLPAGVTDLGTLVAVRPATAFAGLVVDEAGAPVADAQLVVARVVGENERWVSGAATVADDAGAFTVRADLAPGDYQLHASADGFLMADPVPASVGAEDLRVTLLHAAAVRGRLELGPDVPAGRVRVEVSSLSFERDWPSRPSRASSATRARGAFRLDTLYPGKSLLAVRVPGLAEPALEREIDLAPGKNDVGTLDVTGAIHALELRVRDADGRDVSRGYALVGTGEAVRRAAFAGGRLSLLATALPLDVEVRADGYLPAVVHDLSVGQTIVLARAEPVFVVVDAAVPPALELRLALVPESEATAFEESLLLGADGRHEVAPGGWLSEGATTIASSGPTEIAVQGAGTYRPRWRLRDADGAERGIEPRESPVELVPGATVHLAPDAGSLADATVKLAGD